MEMKFNEKTSDFFMFLVSLTINNNDKEKNSTNDAHMICVDVLFPLYMRNTMMTNVLKT